MSVIREILRDNGGVLPARSGPEGYPEIYYPKGSEEGYPMVYFTRDDVLCPDCANKALDAVVEYEMYITGYALLCDRCKRQMDSTFGPEDHYSPY